MSDSDGSDTFHEAGGHYEASYDIKEQFNLTCTSPVPQEKDYNLIQLQGSGPARRGGVA